MIDSMFEHGLSGYRKYRCRCSVCRAANAKYMRVRRAQARGLDVIKVNADGLQPGRVEAAVVAELAMLSAAVSRPGLCEEVRAMARVLDNPRLATSHPAAGRQLVATLERVRAASVERKGKLALVSAMSQRPRL
jgi:hypothetical protein